MRIGLTTHYALPHIGGIESAVSGLRAALESDGHEVVHLSSNIGIESEFAHRWPVVDGEDIRRLSAFGGLERLGIPYPLFGPALRREVNELWKWAEVINCHGFMYQPTLSVARRRRKSGQVALVVTEHVGHVGYPNRLLNLAEAAAVASFGRYSVRVSDRVIALNDRIAAEMSSLAGQAQVAVVGNGVDLEKFSPVGSGDRALLRQELGWNEEPRVLFVGRMVEKKGIGKVRKFAEILRGQCHFVLVGPGAKQDGPFEYLGPQFPSTIRSLMRAADILVLPSHGEGFPVVVQEALASGLAIVATDDPIYSKVVEASRGGFRTASSTEEFVNQIRDLLSIDRSEMSRRLREVALDFFGWEVVKDKYVQIYEEAIEHASHSG